MFAINQKYKFVLKDSFYTGHVLEYHKPLIKIKDKYDKILIINEAEVVKSYPIN